MKETIDFRKKQSSLMDKKVIVTHHYSITNVPCAQLMEQTHITTVDIIYNDISVDTKQWGKFNPILVIDYWNTRGFVYLVGLNFEPSPRPQNEYL